MPISGAQMHQPGEEMKRREFNDLEELILADVTANPGTSQNQIILRMFQHRKAYTYIRNTIISLERRGKIQNIGIGNRTSYVLISLTPPPPL